MMWFRFRRRDHLPAHLNPDYIPPFRPEPPKPGETTFGQHKRQISEVSGYGNPFVQIPVYGVRRIIADGERLERDLSALRNEVASACDMINDAFDPSKKQNIVDFLSAVRQLRTLALPIESVVVTGDFIITDNKEEAEAS